MTQPATLSGVSFWHIMAFIQQLCWGPPQPQISPHSTPYMHTHTTITCMHADDMSSTQHPRTLRQQWPACMHVVIDSTWCMCTHIMMTCTHAHTQTTQCNLTNNAWQMQCDAHALRQEQDAHIHMGRRGQCVCTQTRMTHTHAHEETTTVHMHTGRADKEMDWDSCSDWAVYSSCCVPCNIVHYVQNQVINAWVKVWLKTSLNWSCVVLVSCKVSKTKTEKVENSIRLWPMVQLPSVTVWFSSDQIPVLLTGPEG